MKFVCVCLFLGVGVNDGWLASRDKQRDNWHLCRDDFMMGWLGRKVLYILEANIYNGVFFYPITLT